MSAFSHLLAAGLAVALALGAESAAAASVRIAVIGSVPELKNENNDLFLPGYFGPGAITIDAAFTVSGDTYAALQVSDIDATLTWENGAKVATATTGVNFLPGGGNATQGFLSAVFFVDTAPSSSEGNLTEFGLTLAIPEDPFQAILERDGARGTVTLTPVAPVPLPAAGVLAAGAFGLLALIRQRRRP